MALRGEPRAGGLGVCRASHGGRPPGSLGSIRWLGIKFLRTREEAGPVPAEAAVQYHDATLRVTPGSFLATNPPSAPCSTTLALGLLKVLVCSREIHVLTCQNQ